MADPSTRYELEQLANQPGTYFNPHTEVVLIVDDSISIDQDVFDGVAGDEWVRISDEVPVDEGGLDVAIENFQSTYHPAGESVTAATLDPDDTDDDPALDILEPDEDQDE